MDNSETLLRAKRAGSGSRFNTPTRATSPPPPPKSEHSMQVIREELERQASIQSLAKFGRDTLTTSNPSSEEVSGNTEMRIEKTSSNEDEISTSSLSPGKLVRVPRLRLANKAKRHLVRLSVRDNDEFAQDAMSWFEGGESRLLAGIEFAPASALSDSGETSPSADDGMVEVSSLSITQLVVFLAPTRWLDKDELQVWQNTVETAMVTLPLFSPTPSFMDRLLVWLDSDAKTPRSEALREDFVRGIILNWIKLSPFTLDVNHPLLTERFQDLHTAANERIKLHKQQTAMFPFMLNIKRSNNEEQLYSLADVDPRSLAVNLSWIGNRLFCRIQPEELLNNSWMDENTKHEFAPNIVAFIDHFNHCYHWFCTEILREPEAKDRARIITNLVKAAAHCRRLRNFMGLYMIVAALSSASVSRLHLTFKLVPKRILAVYHELEALMQPDRNWKNYREALQTACRDAAKDTSISEKLIEGLKSPRGAGRASSSDSLLSSDRGSTLGSSTPSLANTHSELSHSDSTTTSHSTGELPVVPHLAVTLSDLVFMDSCMSTFKNSSSSSVPRINFLKCHAMSAAILEIISMQVPYTLNSVDNMAPLNQSVSEWIMKADVWGDSGEHLVLSRLREPQVSSQSRQRQDLALKEPISENDWELMLGAADEVIYKKGEVILAEETDNSSLYKIACGSAVVLIGNQQIATLKEGQIFGEMSILGRLVTTATVVADGIEGIDGTSTSVLQIDFNHLLVVFGQDLNLAERFFHGLATKLAWRLLEANPEKPDTHDAPVAPVSATLDALLLMERLAPVSQEERTKLGKDDSTMNLLAFRKQSDSLGDSLSLSSSSSSINVDERRKSLVRRTSQGKRLSIVMDANELANLNPLSTSPPGPVDKPRPGVRRRSSEQSVLVGDSSHSDEELVERYHRNFSFLGNEILIKAVKCKWRVTTTSRKIKKDGTGSARRRHRKVSSGFMFVCGRHVCFFEKIFGYKNKMSIPSVEIESVLAGEAVDTGSSIARGSALRGSRVGDENTISLLCVNSEGEPDRTIDIALNRNVDKTMTQDLVTVIETVCRIGTDAPALLRKQRSKDLSAYVHDAFDKFRRGSTEEVMPERATENPEHDPDELRRINMARATARAFLLQSGDWQILLKGAMKVKLSDGQVLLHEDVVSSKIFFLGEGTVAIRQKGSEIVRLEAPQVLGEISYLTNAPTTASVVAVGDCLTYQLDRSFTLALFEYFPEIAPRFYVYLASILSARASVMQHRAAVMSQ